jgi:hypothetical protein
MWIPVIKIPMMSQFKPVSTNWWIHANPPETEILGGDDEILGGDDGVIGDQSRYRNSLAKWKRYHAELPSRVTSGLIQSVIIASIRSVKEPTNHQLNSMACATMQMISRKVCISPIEIEVAVAVRIWNPHSTAPVSICSGLGRITNLRALQNG